MGLVLVAVLGAVHERQPERAVAVGADDGLAQTKHGGLGGASRRVGQVVGAGSRAGADARRQHVGVVPVATGEQRSQHGVGSGDGRGRDGYHHALHTGGGRLHGLTLNSVQDGGEGRLEAGVARLRVEVDQGAPEAVWGQRDVLAKDRRAVADGTDARRQRVQRRLDLVERPVDLLQHRVAGAAGGHSGERTGEFVAGHRHRVSLV